MLAKSLHYIMPDQDWHQEPAGKADQSVKTQGLLPHVLCAGVAVVML